MSLDLFFVVLGRLEDLLWSYIGFTMIVLSGAYFTIKSRGFQFKTILLTVNNFKQMAKEASGSKRGVHPFLLYFASIGGMVGLGNIVSVTSAVIIGGPGALFWMWVASFVGMLIKYSDIFLGMKYRIENDKGGYDGGPMYYLQAAFKGKVLPFLVCIFLCIYGVEIYQFVILTDTIVSVTNIDRLYVILVLLVMVFYVAFGGVKRLASICTIIMPVFMLCYIGCCVWIIWQNGHALPGVLETVWNSAFTGHAAVGGFVGSSMLVTAQQGISKAVYSGDIGIGYDSIVQSETQVKNPMTQAKISIFALLNDTLICTMSCLVILVSGIWATEIKMAHSEYIRVVFNQFIPNTDVFLAFVFFFTGFTTITSYLVAGMKCARFLNPKFGEKFYFIYGCISFMIFSWYDQTQVMSVMAISGGFLMLFNLIGIFKLRNEIDFK